MTCKLDVGVWIDEPPSTVFSQGRIPLVQSLPISHVAVMTDGVKPGLNLRWSEKDLERLAKELPDQERIVTLWAEPTVSSISSIRGRVKSLVDALGASAVEVDLEGGWRTKHLSGYASMQEAGDALHGALWQAGRPIEVTTFPSHPEAGPNAAMSSDRLVLQCYAVSERSGQPVQIGGLLGPMLYPKRSIRLARNAHPSREIVAGLAAYKQAWKHPPSDPMVVMRTALQSARSAGVGRVRYWSLRHVATNGYARRFLATL